MPAAVHQETKLAYDDTGTGQPVVFLHGLTFDRRTWRPIVERMADSVRSIAIDLPAHGESGGAPAPLEDVAEEVHDLLASLAVERPVVVGHSMAAGIAFFYALAYPSAGVVVVDSGGEIRPFAELLQRLEPVLRGPGFEGVWPQIESTLGLERIPEPVRSLVLETHVVRQDVVLGYWEPLMQADPAEFQASIDARVAAQLSSFDVPCLAVFGRPLTDGERERFEQLPDFQLEEWTGDGHFVHLVDADRFATRLLRFVHHCSARHRAGSQSSA
jgi:pimeloyl-ACP methyl ester carboxylesterase